ncbi:MAG: TlpA family protein disulfide reductase [Oscillospiraceae bacterium]|nr:TlpA family protein disulfide reductase [Oscillospiraceae bacterium]
MKRLFAIILALLLVCAFAACDILEEFRDGYGDGWADPSPSDGGGLGEPSADNPGGGTNGDGKDGANGGGGSDGGNGEPELGGFPFPFSAADLYENPVTEASLGDKQVYFVHYWGTWCPPCVDEMPDLGAMAELYGGDVGFLALLQDYSTNLDGALNIVKASGVPKSFIMVDEQTPGLEKLANMLSTGYVPTTVLIGADGAMIGEPIIGAYGMGYSVMLDGSLGR